jgi:hypothetical protein
MPNIKKKRLRLKKKKKNNGGGGLKNIENFAKKSPK